MIRGNFVIGELLRLIPSKLSPSPIGDPRRGGDPVFHTWKDWDWIEVKGLGLGHE